MPRYMVERSFPDGLNIPLTEAGAQTCLGVVGRNAELEASLVSRECLGQRRVPSLVDLISLVAAWRRRAEEEHRIIEWRFRVDDARRVFRYEGLTTRRSEH